MKRTHPLFNVQRTDPVNEPLTFRRRKKIHPAVQPPVGRPSNPIPSTSRDARLILDVSQAPDSADGPNKSPLPQPKETAGDSSSDSSVPPNKLKPQSVGNGTGAAAVVKKLAKRRRRTKAKSASLVGNARSRLGEIGNNDPGLELNRKAGESYLAYQARLVSLRLGIQRDKLREWWKSIKKKKEEWDKWNPDRSHPLVRCIDESKMAGLKETIKPNRGIIWRVMWGIIWATALITGVKFCIDAFYFHEHYPILFGFRKEEIPISKNVYPTVTVCPFYGFRTSTIKDIEELFSNVRQQKNTEWTTDEVAHMMTMVDHICNSKSTMDSHRKATFQAKNYEHLLDNLKPMNHDSIKRIRAYLEERSTLLQDLIKMCKWNLKEQNCSEIFKPKLTKHGMCYTFNAMPSQDLFSSKEARALKEDDTESSSSWNNWNLDQHFGNENRNSKESNGPKAQPTGGRRWGLKLLLKTEDAFSGDCPQFDGSGPRVSVSVPGLDTDVSKLSSAVTPNSDVTIKLYPDLTLADLDIADIPPERRGCLFQNEKKLTYFEKYTQENCYQECLANHTVAKCGCTLISLPNFPGEPLCLNFEEIDCADNVESDIFTNSAVCSECSPSCSQMTIREELSSTPLAEEARQAYSGGKNESVSTVSLFYAPDSVVGRERERRHGKYELFSVMGSIFEATNDMSVLGFARSVVGLYELRPAVLTLLQLLLKKLVAGGICFYSLIAAKLCGDQDAVLPFVNGPANASNGI